MNAIRSRPARLAYLGWLVAVTLMLLPAVSSAEFHQLGGSLNVDPAGDSGRPAAIAAIGGVPYVAFSERDGSAPSQLRVMRFDGTNWVAVGGMLNIDTSHYADYASIASIDGVPYVTWVESNQIWAKRFDSASSSWVLVGGSLNVSTSSIADTPKIANIGASSVSAGVPYVTWLEEAGGKQQVRVKRFDGTSWVAVGGTLNIDVANDAFSPQIANVGGGILSGGSAYVTWKESNGTAYQVRVKRFDSATAQWVTVGGALNFDVTKNAVPGGIANIGKTSVGGIPYVALAESNGTTQQVRVAKFSASAWSFVGGSLNVDPASEAGSPSIANVDGIPYVSWIERTAGVQRVRVKHFDGTGWVTLGGSLSAHVGEDATSAGIANVAGAPDVAWVENDMAACGLACAETRVARELAPVCNGASVSVPHDTATVVPLACNEGTRAITNTPAHGTLSAIDQAAGTVTYTPEPGYGGSDSFGFKSSDGTLESDAATAALDVAAAPDVPVVPPTTAPTLTELVLVPPRFRAAAAGASTAARPKRAPIGTQIRFTLDRAATTSFAVARLRPGVRKGKRCVAPSRNKTKGRKPKHCTRSQQRGHFARSSSEGANRFRFTGRINGRALPPGNYRLAVTPQAADGKIGATLRKSFAIVR